VGGVGVGVAEARYVPTPFRLSVHATGVVAVLSAESCDGMVLVQRFADCLQISSSLAPARTSCPLRPLFAPISMASAYGWRFRTQGTRLRSSICWRPREVCNRLLRR
jgi:hypothetical protein